MKTLLRKHPYWAICFVAIICMTFYWSLWATDRYVSEATVILQSAKTSSMDEFSISSLLSGDSGSHQLLVLREYLLSTDMLQKLNKKLDLRDHYSSHDIDFFSRLWSSDVPMGEFHDYYKRRVKVELDDYAKVLKISAQAYTPEMAQAIVKILLRAGEKRLNQMNRRLAAEQVDFIKTQVDELKNRLESAKNTVLDYQNEHQIISPTGTVKTLTTVVATLQGNLAQLNAHRRALGATHSANSAAVKQVDREISALQSQIKELRSHMAAKSGTALNSESAKYNTLQLRLNFARKMYTKALAALETIRVQAATSLKKVSVLQSPALPQYSTAPERFRDIMVFIIFAVLTALIVHLLAAIVRDHKD